MYITNLKAYKSILVNKITIINEVSIDMITIQMLVYSDWEIDI